MAVIQLVFLYRRQRGESSGSRYLALKTDDMNFNSPFSPSATPGLTNKFRFRKRDKVLFYGRKMLRKVKNFSGKVQRAGRKRHNMLKLAREILYLRRDPGQKTQLQVLEPPEAFLEADMSSDLDDRLPPEVIYMLKSIRPVQRFLFHLKLVLIS